MNQLPLRPNVCMLVRNNEHKLLLGERCGEGGIWQFPQGGVEVGSSLEENVLRELHEELGADMDLFRIVRKLQTTHEYEFAKPPSYALGIYRGQTQTFWLVDFLGKDSDMKLDRFHPEFQSFRWCTIREVQSLAEPRRMTGYSRALAEVETDIIR